MAGSMKTNSITKKYFCVVAISCLFLFLLILSSLCLTKFNAVYHAVLHKQTNSRQNSSVSAERTAERPIYAICSFVSTHDFIPGAQVLGYSASELKKPHTELVMLVIRDKGMSWLGMQGLRAAGWKVKIVDRIAPPPGTSYPNWKLEDCFTKYSVWNMTEYSEIMMMDSDVIILKPVNDIMEKEYRFAARGEPGVKNYFNSGMFFLRPNKEFYKYLIESVKKNAYKLSQFIALDQLMLNKVFYNNWTQLDDTLWANAQHFLNNQQKWKATEKTAKAIHYLGDYKPYVLTFPISQTTPRIPDTVFFNFFDKMVQKWGHQLTIVAIADCNESLQRDYQLKEWPLLIFTKCAANNSKVSDLTIITSIAETPCKKELAKSDLDAALRLCLMRHAIAANPFLSNLVVFYIKLTSTAVDHIRSDVKALLTSIKKQWPSTGSKQTPFNGFIAAVKVTAKDGAKPLMVGGTRNTLRSIQPTDFKNVCTLAQKVAVAYILHYDDKGFNSAYEKESGKKLTSVPSNVCIGF